VTIRGLHEWLAQGGVTLLPDQAARTAPEHLLDLPQALTRLPQRRQRHALLGGGRSKSD
jgi:hypothetical protein